MEIKMNKKETIKIEIEIPKETKAMSIVTIEDGGNSYIMNNGLYTTEDIINAKKKIEDYKDLQAKYYIGQADEIVKKESDKNEK